MQMLVVQKRLPYPARQLHGRAAAFLDDVRQMVDEAKEQHVSLPLELSEIGFIPARDYIEVKLYFREREQAAELEMRS